MKAFIVQPTVPHYRTEFFSGIARRLGGQLTLMASPHIPGGPSSVPARDLGDMRYAPDHTLSSWRGDKLYWQSGLNIQGASAGDVLLVPGNPRFLSVYPLLIKARARGMGIIVQGHGWSSSSRPWLARIRHLLWRFADVALLYTDEEREQFIANGFAPDRVFATNNTMGTQAIEQARAHWTPDRLETGAGRVRPSGHQILFCGRLTAKAELQVLLDALAALKQRGQSVQLVIIGGGDQESALKDRAVSLGLAQQITWLGPIHDEMQLAPWFLQSDVFVYPGAIGLSLLHAFNYGLPVVTHDQLKQHNPEISALEPGRSGALFAKGNSAALADTLEGLLNNESLRADMSARAKHTIKTRFHTTIMVDRFMAAAERAHQLAMQRKGMA